MVETPIFQTTFGNGTALVSSVAAANFSFNSVLQQIYSTSLSNGIFFFTNRVDSSDWHFGSPDHTPNDINGYMMIVGSEGPPKEFYRRAADELCISQRYEFSAYMANLVPPRGLENPIVRFEIRTAPPLNETIARFDTGPILEKATLTWVKYGVSFVPSNQSVILSMIALVASGGGNDLAVDDITLRPCGSTILDPCV